MANGLKPRQFGDPFPSAFETTTNPFANQGGNSPGMASFEPSGSETAGRRSGFKTFVPPSDATLGRVPAGTRIGTEIVELGRSDFRQARIDWNKVFQQAEAGIPEARALIDQFAPGGGFGAGLRAESRQAIQAGVAKDTATAIASGSSSISSARGINVLAGSEFGKSVANIEDLRATLQVQAFTPYQTLLSNLTALTSVRPTRGQFVETLAIPKFSTGGGVSRVRG